MFSTHIRHIMGTWYHYVGYVHRLYFNIYFVYDRDHKVQPGAPGPRGKEGPPDLR